MYIPWMQNVHLGWQYSHMARFEMLVLPDESLGLVTFFYILIDKRISFKI